MSLLNDNIDKSENSFLLQAFVSFKIWEVCHIFLHK